MNSLTNIVMDDTLNEIQSELNKLSLIHKKEQIEKFMSDNKKEFVKTKLYEKLVSDGVVLDYLRKTNSIFLLKLQFLRDEQKHFIDLKKHKLDSIVKRKFNTKYIIKFFLKQPQLYKYLIPRKRFNELHQFETEIYRYFKSKINDPVINFDILDGNQITPSRNHLLNIISSDITICNEFKEQYDNQFNFIKLKKSKKEDAGIDAGISNIESNIKANILFKNLSKNDDYNQNPLKRKHSVKQIVNALSFDENSRKFNDIPIKSQLKQEYQIINKMNDICKFFLSDIEENEIKDQLDEQLEFTCTQNIQIIIKKLKQKQILNNQNESYIKAMQIFINQCYNNNVDAMEAHDFKFMVENTLKLQSVPVVVNLFS